MCVCIKCKNKNGKIDKISIDWISIKRYILPCKYVFVLRKATESRRMESLSSFERMFCSKGRTEARWSSSPLSLSLEKVPIWLLLQKYLNLTLQASGANSTDGAALACEDANVKISFE